MTNGEFADNFNIALSNLYLDTEFKERINEFNDNQQKLKVKLQSSPEGAENFS